MTETHWPGSVDINNTITKYYDNSATKDLTPIGGNPYEAFFGALPDKEYDVRDRRYETNYDLPHAYLGKNVVLAERVVGLSIKGDQNFLVQEPDGAPIVRTDQMEFQWSEVRFDEVLPQQIAEEGVGRVIRSTYSTDRATTVRRGLAFVVEHGFFKTEAGRRHYVRSLQQIANGFQKALNLTALTKFVQARPKEMEWWKRYGYYNKDNRTLYRKYASSFALLQKSERGIDNLIDARKKVLSRRGVTATTIIIPEGAEKYFNGTAGPEKSKFLNAGNLAIQRLERDPYSVNTFRGLRIRNTRVYDPREDQGPMDPLIRYRQNGEFYRMCGYIDGVGTVKNRSIKIHDMNQDTWKTIDTKLAYKHSHIEMVLRALGGEDININGDMGLIGSPLMPDHVVNRIIDEKVKSMEHKLDTHEIDEDLEGEKVVYGYHDNSNINKSSKDIENEYIQKIHEENKNLLSNDDINITHEATNKYDATFKELEEDKRGQFAQFTNDLLKSDDVNSNTISEKLITPLNKIANLAESKKPTPAEKRSLKTLVQEILTPLPKTKDIPTTTLLSQAPDLHKVSEISQNFKHVDINTHIPLSKSKVYDLNNHKDNFIVRSSHRNLSGLKHKGLKSQQIQGALFPKNNDEFKKETIDKIVTKYAKGDSNRELWLAKLHADLKKNSKAENYFDYLIFRPWQRFQTATMLMGKFGSETAVTPLGHADFMLGDDAVAKMHRGFFTAYFTTIVLNPLNYTIIDDAFIKEYLGGRNTRFYTLDEVKQLQNNHWLPPDELDGPSLLAVALPLGEAQHINNIIDLRGFFDDDDRNKPAKHHFSTNLIYNDIYGFNTIEDTNLYNSDKQMLTNTQMAQGHQFCQAPEEGSKGFTQVIMGINSCLGENIYPGMSRVIEDKEVVFEKQDYNTKFSSYL